MTLRTHSFLGAPTRRTYLLVAGWRREPGVKTDSIVSHCSGCLKILPKSNNCSFLSWIGAASHPIFSLPNSARHSPRAPMGIKSTIAVAPARRSDRSGHACSAWPDVIALHDLTHLLLHCCNVQANQSLNLHTATEIAHGLRYLIQRWTLQCETENLNAAASRHPQKPGDLKMSPPVQNKKNLSPRGTP